MLIFESRGPGSSPDLAVLFELCYSLHSATIITSNVPWQVVCTRTKLPGYLALNKHSYTYSVDSCLLESWLKTLPRTVHW